MSAATNDPSAGAGSGARVGAAVIDITPSPAVPPTGAPSGLLQPAVANGATQTPHKKFAEPLFGPSIGSVSTGPSWTLTCLGERERERARNANPNGVNVNGTATGQDELTSEVVNRWIERSKDPSHPTTTLQALVNLKRPTLRLVPLSESHSEDEITTTSNKPSTNPHAITFTYDCDAPLVNIQINVHIPKSHPFVQAYTSIPFETMVSPNGLSPYPNVPWPYTPYPPPVLPTSSSSSSALARVQLFSITKEGGFGRRLTTDDGAGVELGVWESGAGKKWDLGGGGGGVNAAVRGMVETDGDKYKVEYTEGVGSSQVITSPAPAPVPNAPSGSGTPTGTGTGTNGTPTGQPGDHKKRFSNLHFFKRHGHSNGSGHQSTPSQTRAIAGPALAVVDAAHEAHDPSDPSDPSDPADDPVPSAPAPSAVPSSSALTPNAAGTAKDKNAKGGTQTQEEDIKLSIRLSALSEDGKELESVNEQVTYLSVGRFGIKPIVSAGVSPTKEKKDKGEKDEKEKVEDVHAEGSGEQEEEDKRPWVVKVVKREATIGPHTFHLHEIYGLSSSTSSSDTADAGPTAPHPESQTHTYPPTNPANSDPSEASECLLCLSSPREVVLLPCRHLVACKECALNMVEFGAGGVVSAPGEGDAGGAAGAGAGQGGGANGEGVEGGQAVGGVGGVLAAQAEQRRKRKAKGWFCPVCRQPYTSMLRLSTAAPPLPSPTNSTGNAGLKAKNAAADGEDGDGEGSGTEDEDDNVNGNGNGNGSNANANVNASNTNTNEGAQTAQPAGGGGFLSVPFLRGLSVGSVGSALGLSSSTSRGTQGDVESGAATGGRV